MESQRAQRALHLSIAVIVVEWFVNSLRASTVPSGVWPMVGFMAFKTVLVATLVFSLVRASGETPAVLGLRRSPVIRPVLVGVGFGFVLFVLFSVLLGPILRGVLGGPPTPPAVMALLHDPNNLPFWIVTAAGAGFTEELARIFALTSFQRAFGRTGLIVALLVDSVAFGMTHRYQGTVGVITNAIFGVTIGLFFLRRRNATEVMVAHGVNDLIAILIAFAMGGRV